MIRGVIRFERHLAFPIRDVWDAITNPERIAQNFAVADIALTPDELDRIDALIGGAERVTDRVDAASGLADKVITSPVVKVMAVGTGADPAVAEALVKARADALS